MNKKVLLQRIKRTSDEVSQLERTMLSLQSVDVTRYPENYSNIIQNAVIRAENITKNLRELAYNMTDISKDDMFKGIVYELGISVSRDSDDTLEITIPCLVPNRNKKPTDFITAPLHTALERFVAGESEAKEPADGSHLPKHLPFQRFENCVICIVHIYNKDLIAKGRYRDYDNIELKGIIDTINTFLLTDDNGILCDIYNTSQISDEDLTLIFIIKKDIFPKWILAYVNVDEIPC